ncbi:MAG: YceI family protein [Pseudoruegeria sp.]
MNRIIALFFLLISVSAATADPVAYTLQPELSDVGFTYRLNAEKQRGTMPIQQATVQIDFEELAQSSVDVVLSAKEATTKLPFVNEAMKSSKVLDTKNHPSIRFKSQSITGTTSNAQIKGDLTIRGETRPVTLTARLYRQRGQAADDLTKLTILLTGTISRKAFGADGFPEFVKDEIGLNIRARIESAE